MVIGRNNPVWPARLSCSIFCLVLTNIRFFAGLYISAMSGTLFVFLQTISMTQHITLLLLVIYKSGVISLQMYRGPEFMTCVIHVFVKCLINQVNGLPSFRRPFLLQLPMIKTTTSEIINKSILIPPVYTYMLYLEK